MIGRPRSSPLFPSTPLSRSPATPADDFTRQQPSRRYYYTESCFLFQRLRERLEKEWIPGLQKLMTMPDDDFPLLWDADFCRPGDRKSTRLNSSHQIISYAVF